MRVPLDELRAKLRAQRGAPAPKVTSREKRKRIARHKWRLKHDDQYALRTELRQRLGSLLRVGSAVEHIGCTIEEFLTHIENHKNWDPSWTWEDWGTLFQIDHIKALALFDLTDPEQFALANHYMNLQPLSIAAHKRKSARDMKLIRRSKGL